MSLQTESCEHLDYSDAELTALIALKKLRNAQGIFARYGNGPGCPCCAGRISDVLRELRTTEKLRTAAWAAGSYELPSREDDIHVTDGSDPDVREIAVTLHRRYARFRRVFPLQIVVTSDESATSAARWADVGIIVVNGQFDLYVCGQGASSPRHGHLLVSGESPEAAIRYLDRFVVYYVSTADTYTRTAPWSDMLEDAAAHLRSIIVEDKLRLEAEFDELYQQLSGAGRARKRWASFGVEEDEQQTPSFLRSRTPWKPERSHPFGPPPVLGTSDTDVAGFDVTDSDMPSLIPQHLATKVEGAHVHLEFPTSPVHS
ncbi:hypothetical protein SH661x_004422 [Planctomicrobium sp. SH661]|uniref:hypothetical protein n=1 Tax=Planctomicrobium sp. SH661 TaxID=3448124 RepID=UPI003F5C9683